ncbi:hypothetical protein DFR67_11496 [Williamsia limnetica]|jgi:hypothetical protein|uniref:Uncharacterized protein n=1 Tax=Williamsia limnetica TaxID=882452 RepID=A0A318RW63_WILLI|nr:hypothetical protein [Williamsia limnetica]PYE13997.1 hypothetical protein DFR67_11496 [Williamsia limnetica]
MSRSTKFVPAALAAAGAACVIAGTVSGAGAAFAEASSPMPVGDSQFGYIATHALTQSAADMNLPEFVASIPVPPEYKPANLALAARFDIVVDEALASPGGCIQVVIDPAPTSGGVFSYGFFAVEGEYCQP